MTVFAESGLLLGRRASENCSQAHADGKQASCFAEDQIEMLIERNQLSELLDLQQLALDHLLGEFDEGVENPEVPLLHGDLESLHVQPVARQDALGISPLGIRGRTTTPGFRIVDDVIVNQGGRVNDLDDSAESNRATSLVLQQLGGKQQQSRTNSLAAARSQVL